MTIIAGIVIVTGMLLLASCGKKESSPDVHKDHAQGMQHAGEADKPAEEVITQTVCPVMGGKINKDIFVEHNGRKIYFCCAGCPEAFKKDPARYMNKL